MYSARSAARPPTVLLTQDDALSLLEYWHTSAEPLMLVHRRPDERVTRIGRGRVRSATVQELRIETPHGPLRITMHSADFEFRTLARAATPCVRKTPADGLLIHLGPDHWAFLRSAPELPRSNGSGAMRRGGECRQLLGHRRQRTQARKFRFANDPR